MPYTGNLVMSARYPTSNMSVGVSEEHRAGAAPDDADLFGGSAPAGPGPDYGSPGRWVDPELGAPQTAGLRYDPQSHVSRTAPRLTAPRLGWVEAQQVAQAQMLAAHSARDSATEASKPREQQFEFRGQRNLVNRQEGQRSWEPGLSGPLARGANSYAQNNPSTIVYDGEGMRYGYDVLTWGEYRTPVPFERRYRIRAVAREEVHFPVDTPVIDNARPGGNFGSGTQTTHKPWSIPRLFAPPSAHAMSDVTMSTQGDATAGGFAADGWG